MIINDVKAHLQKVVDWARLYRLIHSIGNSFDSKQRLALKGELFERAVTQYANNTIKYIGDSTIDGDLELLEYKNIIVEQKYQKGCLFGKNSRIKLMRKMHSGGTVEDIKKKKFSYVLALDEMGAGLFSKDYVCDNLVLSGGSIIYFKCNIKDACVICGPYDKQPSHPIDFNKFLINLIESVA